MCTLIGFNLCSCSGPQTPRGADKLDTLVGYMTGSFNSEEQATADSSYFNISLHMYPIWKNKEGHWLYVEQALNSRQENPYRQRVYEVRSSSNEAFSSVVYTLKDEKNFIGKWETPEFFDQFDASILEEREGCAVYLAAKNDGSFSGSTKEENCKSSLRGASYATSKVTIFEDRIESWDQGFDSTATQVWGAEKGGYVFNRLN